MSQFVGYTASGHYPGETPQFEHFKSGRLAIFFATAVAAAIVLGIAVQFANIFLPQFHGPFTIFAIVVPSLTILVLIIMVVQGAPPAPGDIGILIALGLLWLTMGAWSGDIIGHVSCFPLAGQTTPSKNGSFSSQAYCERMKVIEAFSWVAFSLLLVCSYLAIKYVTDDEEGYPLEGGFGAGSYPGASGFGAGYGGAYGAGPGQYGGYSAMPPAMAQNQMPTVVQQQPWHNVVIQQTRSGVPMIQQVPAESSLPRANYM